MKNQTGFSIIETLLTVSVIGLIGFSGYYLIANNDQNTQLSQNNSSSVELRDELPADLSNLKSINQIQTIAVGENSGASIVGIELETFEGITIYVVHFSDDSKIFFDAFSGNKVDHNDDNDDEIDDNQMLPTNFTVDITIQEAITIAKQKRPNSTVTKVELEVEEGIVVYSVRFSDKSRVDVNALNGTIQRLKNENGIDEIKVDDDFDDDGIDNPEDDDDDNDGIEDDEDDDDDNDGIEDDDDDDDDNDGLEDDDDDDDDEERS